MSDRTTAEFQAGTARSPATGAGAQLSLLDPLDVVTFRHSRRARRLSLRVFPHGVVEVVIPPRTARQRVEEFLRAHRDWIAEARRTLLGSHASPAVDPPLRIVLPAVGECWRVAYRPGDGRLVQEPSENGGRLLLEGPADESWQLSRIRAWLKLRAREVLVPWLAATGAECGLSYSAVSIRRQRSRWGSCSSQRRISLNCALLFIEPALVRYLFVHELCHTRHLNHSRAFWRLVERMEPGFEDLEAALSAAWRRVPAWVSYDPPRV